MTIDGAWNSNSLRSGTRWVRWESRAIKDEGSSAAMQVMPGPHHKQEFQAFGACLRQVVKDRWEQVIIQGTP